METQIIVNIDQSGPMNVYFPANDQAKTIARIAGTKTLQPTVLMNCESLGFEIIVKLPHGYNSK